MVPGSLPSRAAALALLGLVLALAYGLAVQPYLDRLRSHDEAIAELGHRLGQYARIASARTQLENQIEAMQAQLPLDEELLAGDTAPLAGAELLDLVKGILLEHRGNVSSARPAEPVAEGDLQRIGVEFTFESDIAALKAMLYEIESGRPVLFVDGLRIRAETTAAPDGRPGEWAPVPLTVELEVHGYRRAEEP
jgi:general secretion pathway protein M